MIDYNLSVPESDELGPGSDLVISMFALAMLAIALVGSGAGASRPTVTGLEEQNAALSKQVATLQARVTASEKALYTTGLKAEPDAAVGRDLADANKVLLQQLREARATVARALQIEAENKLLSEQLRKKSADNNSLLQQIEQVRAEAGTRKQAAIPENSLLTLRDTAGKNYFRQGSATISSEGRSLLVATLHARAGLIRSKQFNVIMVEGYTSPETYRLDGYGDTSDRLAFDRAAAVQRIMVDAGIPRRCLGVMAFGRNRSNILFGSEALLPRGTEADLARFDDSYSSGRVRIAPEKLASERRIEVRAILDPTYNLCSSGELADSLQAAQ